MKMKALVSKEFVVLCRWGGEKSMKHVDKGKI